jgi:Fe-S cluster assembly ATPase SufC
MKKIDLHTHTISTSSDSYFDFDLAKLIDYVNQLGLDCIAITNHNVFDLEQYNLVSDSLNILVLPGIEIDLEGGHILLIADKASVADFSDRCKNISALITGDVKSITAAQLKSVFQDLSRYLLIPHYDKKPIISSEIISELTEYIHAGEVSSVRKFKACIRDENKLTPVLFSDSRFHKDLESFSTRHTFVDLEKISFRGIKACLSDKGKVALSKQDGNKIFQVTDDGLFLSTGLNVIFGERSSGKTFTLDRICDCEENVKYIRQFSLLQNDEQRFKELVTIGQSSVSESYLTEFKTVIEDILKVDIDQNGLNLEKYITSLVRFAIEFDKEDSFSKAALFSETLYPETSLNDLKKLIDAANLLLNNNEYKGIVEKHLPTANLKSLLIELINKYKGIHESNAKKKWINDLVSDIKKGLRSRTSLTYPEEIDFYKIIFEDQKVKKFLQVVESIRKEREIYRKEIQGFKIVARTQNYANATQLKDRSGKKTPFVEVFNSYNEPYEFLQKLKNKESLPETELYKYFVDIDYDTLNKDGYRVSGGERSEFNLLNEINDALKHDLLLIDEPESSFDNLFLKTQVNQLLKHIAKEIPVIVVTHNNTVGASIHPDYIIYTQKVAEAGEIKYKVFTGYPSDKELTSPGGERVKTYDIMLDCLEAGHDAYTNRRTKNYEILKD